MTNNELMLMFRSENDIDLDEPLFTYNVWKSKGYCVKHGEKAKYKVTLWKYSSKEKTNDNGETVTTSKCFPKVVALFTKEQVEPME